MSNEPKAGDGLDKVIAEFEADNPDCGWDLGTVNDGSYSCAVWKKNATSLLDKHQSYHHASGKTPALAMKAAIEKRSHDVGETSTP